MLWWELLLIIISILVIIITISIFVIFIIIDLKKDYKILKTLNIIAKDLEKR